MFSSNLQYPVSANVQNIQIDGLEPKLTGSEICRTYGERACRDITTYQYIYSYLPISIDAPPAIAIAICIPIPSGPMYWGNPITTYHVNHGTVKVLLLWTCHSIVCGTPPHASIVRSDYAITNFLPLFTFQCSILLEKQAPHFFFFSTS